VLRTRRRPEREGKSGRRQGCQRLGRIVHRGKTTPTSVNGSREAEVTEQSVFDDDPPKRSRTM